MCIVCLVRKHTRCLGEKQSGVRGITDKHTVYLHPQIWDLFRIWDDWRSFKMCCFSVHSLIRSHTCLCVNYYKASRTNAISYHVTFTYSCTHTTSILYRRRDGECTAYCHLIRRAGDWCNLDQSRINTWWRQTAAGSPGQCVCGRGVSFAIYSTFENTHCCTLLSRSSLLSRLSTRSL